jgi:hypothetical protein
MMNSIAEPAIPHDDNEPTQPPCRIEATLITKLNLADFQNAVPLLRELRLINDGETPIRQLELTISSIPSFLKPKTWRIEAVGAGKRCHIPDLDVRLDGPLLTRLTEAESATVSFTLCSSRDETPEELARLERPVELLPRNQWGRTLPPAGYGGRICSAE